MSDEYAARRGWLVPQSCWRTLWKRKRWWLIPLVTALLLFGLLLIFATASGVAPFIYTLF